MQPELSHVQLKELGRLSRGCEMTGREICLVLRGIYPTTMEHGSPRRFGLVGWPRPSDVGFDTSMERFIAQTSDQTILMN